MKSTIFFTVILILIFYASPTFSQSGVVKPFKPNPNMFTIKGDFTMIGNSNLTKAPGRNNPVGGLDPDNNDGINMVFIDIDGDASTANSSAATLILPAENNMDPSNTEIVYAGLYWTGRAFSAFNNEKARITFFNIDNGHQFDTRSVKLKGPNASGYETITANYSLTNGSNSNKTDIYFPLGDSRSNDYFYNMYVGYADVTDYVKAQGVGEYTVADIALREGNANGIGYYGGWMMVVVYKNPDMRSRNISLFDGYAFVDNNTTANYTIPVDGFKAQPEGIVRAKIGYFAGEGDLASEGDFLRIKKTGTTGNSNSDWVTLDHGPNTKENFFNSSIVGVENRTPKNSNNYGIDLGIIELDNLNNSIINNNDESTVFRYGTKKETYIISFLAFSIETLQFNGLVVNDANGNNDNLVNDTQGTAEFLPDVYVNVIKTSTNKLIATKPIDTRGRFDLKSVFEDPDGGPGDYIVQLSTNQGVAGQIQMASNRPDEWVFMGNSNNGGTPTGEQYQGRQAFTMSYNGDVTGLVLGLNKMPKATEKLFTDVDAAYFDDRSLTSYLGIPMSSAALSGYNATGGSLSGTDLEDCPDPDGCNTETNTTFIIKSIKPNTRLFYDFGNGSEEVVVTNGDVIIRNYDVAKMTFFGEENGFGVQTYGFEYSISDAADVQSEQVEYNIIPNRTLPIELINFDAVKQDEHALLTWSTATEQNNIGFDIERSTNGQNWSVIDHVNSKSVNGNSSVKLNYQYTDNNPEDGINYYRLRQTDIDGRSTVSMVRVLTFDAASGVIIYPNPVRTSAVVKGLSGRETLRVYDAEGRIVRSEKVNTKQSTLNFGNLAHGTYRVQVIAADGRLIKTLSVVKVR